MRWCLLATGQSRRIWFRTTYLRALEAAGRLRENSNVKGWVFTILRNLWFNELRKRRLNLLLSGAEGYPLEVERVPDGRLDPFATYVKARESEMVRGALKKLPLHSRQIILMRDYEGLSYREIAEVLG